MNNLNVDPELIENILILNSAAYELSTRAAMGENEKYEILEKELFQPLNRLCLSNDRYTQEHATEAIAELLTLPAIQVIIINYLS